MTAPIEPRMVVELMRSVARLALEPDAQRQLAEELEIAPLMDELALSLYDMALLAPQFLQRGWLTEAEAAGVAQLDALLANMSETGPESIWLVSSLDRIEWQEVRECARSFLRAKST